MVENIPFIFHLLPNIVTALRLIIGVIVFRPSHRAIFSIPARDVYVFG